MAKVRADWPATKRATTVTSAGGWIIVTYQRTEVFRWHPGSGKIWLNSGGYSTYTTKARINEALQHFQLDRFGVYQKAFEWFVSDLRTGESVPFHDGMIIDVDTSQPHDAQSAIRWREANERAKQAIAEVLPIALD